MTPAKNIRGHGHTSPFTGCKGWETEAEQGLLIMVASWVSEGGSPTIIAEIGSENGMSASIFRSYAPLAHLICIEIDEDAHFVHNLFELELDNKRFFHPVFANSALTSWSKVLEIVREDTKKLPEDALIDLLFIDGDHSYYGALADLQNFAPFVSNGGYMLLHDTACPTNKTPHEQHKDVSKALAHFLENEGKSLGFTFLFSVDTLSVFRRG